MRRTPQAHFTTLHQPINQGDSETQRIPTSMFVRLTQRTLGFAGFLYAYAGISGLMYFESTFDFQHRSTQPTGLSVRFRHGRCGFQPHRDRKDHLASIKKGAV